MTNRVRCPLNLIDGPAKVYFAMKAGEFYSATELEEASGVAKSTCARYIATLRDAGIVTCYRGHNPRGRPSYFYSIAQQEQAA